MKLIKINITGDAKKDEASFDAAIKEFKKETKKHNILNELRRRESYMSPSKYKKWKRNEATKRRKVEERKNVWNKKNKQEW